MPKVSIIVPVYKVEPYLKRCVDSLTNQTLRDIEIILVDDGSPDNCPQMCDEFAKQDSRIKVIHKINGGQGSARNAGIRVAAGDYIGFVDSDDSAEPDMYEKLYDCAVKTDVDFAMADYYRVCADERIPKTLDIRAGLYSKSDIQNEIFPMLIMREAVDFGPLLSVCNCLYKTEFLRDNNLYFDEEIKVAEDCIYSAILGYRARSFYYLKGAYVYNYMVNAGSTSRSYKPALWNIYCKMNEKLRNFFENRPDFDFSRQLDIHIFYFACSVFSQLRYSDLSFKEKYAVRKEVLSSPVFRNTAKTFRLPNVNFKFKTLLWLMKHRHPLIISML